VLNPSVKPAPGPTTSRGREVGSSGGAAVQVLDPSSDKIVGEIPTGPSPHFVDLFDGNPAGLIVVQGPGELVLFDPETNKTIRSFQVGKQPHWAALSGDGKTAYVTNEGSNDVSVVDLASGKIAQIAVGHAPRKAVVQPQDTAKHADAGSAAKVSIANFAFEPAAVTIHPGDSVTWRNDDASPHAIVFKDGAPGAASLFPGESFTRSFASPGTYEYSCSFHPYMTGKVEVVGSST